MDGYNVYCVDRPKKGGGVAIYVKSKFHIRVVLSESICKQLQILAVEIAAGLCVAVVGCYRLPSALNDAFQSLMQLLSRLNYSRMF